MVMFWIAALAVESVLTVLAVVKSAESDQSEDTGSDAGAN